ncbi:hypothetical protein QKW35_20580 [Pontibacterium granulatum]|uniref:hypothetical protein n=1 Tax=Pontibacterium granulatum TaxID=2036029 RepID=UPI00249AF9E2|nr:hypothetical protein [Pontibacterium granulatum]MDI3326780.1 hypothetical protein [Pontibacterium granulatum]
MISLNTISLPDDLIWADEFGWTPVRQNQDVSLSGALIVEEAAQQKGRPITLTGNDEVWATRATIEALYALAQQPATPMALTLHDRTFSVLFRHGEGALEAQPVVAHSNPDASTYYTLTLRLIEI